MSEEAEEEENETEDVRKQNQVVCKERNTQLHLDN